MSTQPEDERSTRIRQARQVLSGSDVRQPQGPFDFGPAEGLVNPTQRTYLIVLGVLLAVGLILLFALSANWASPIFFLLALALLAGWVIF